MHSFYLKKKPNLAVAALEEYRRTVKTGSWIADCLLFSYLETYGRRAEQIIDCVKSFIFKQECPSSFELSHFWAAGEA